MILGHSGGPRVATRGLKSGRERQMRKASGMWERLLLKMEGGALSQGLRAGGKTNFLILTITARGNKV